MHIKRGLRSGASDIYLFIFQDTENMYQDSMCDVFSLGNTVAPNISLLQLKKDDIYVLIVTSKNNKASSREHELCCFI